MLTAASIGLAKKEVEEQAATLARFRRHMTSPRWTRRWFTAAAVELANQIRNPAYFYSQSWMLRPKPPRVWDVSRSVGATRRSVRVLRAPASATSGSAPSSGPTPRVGLGRNPIGTATVAMGGTPQAYWGRWVERGRRRRTQTPGATGPLPGQRILGRALNAFGGNALRAFNGAMAADFEAVAAGARLRRG